MRFLPSGFRDMQSVITSHGFYVDFIPRLARKHMEASGRFRWALDMSRREIKDTYFFYTTLELNGKLLEAIFQRILKPPTLEKLRVRKYVKYHSIFVENIFPHS